MQAKGEKRHLDRVAHKLLAPLLEEPYSARSGWRLMGYDAEQGISLFLEGHGRVLLMELDRRNETRDCYAHTALFNVVVRNYYAPRTPLTAMDHALTARLIKLIRHRERGIELPERPTTGRRSMVRLIEVDRLLVAEGFGQYYINPYVGCTIGCPFCWAAERADLSRHLEGLPRMGWGRYVDVKVNAPEILADEITGHPPGPVRFSPVVTDPYQPIERHHRITRRCLEVLEGSGFTPVILTRAARVLEDLPLLRRFSDALVGFSIPTDDDSVRRKFEPGADPIEERLNALAVLRNAGVATFALIQPVLPMDPERLITLLAPLVDTVRIDRLHLSSDTEASPAEASGALPAAEGNRLQRMLHEGLRAHGVAVDDMDLLNRPAPRERGHPPETED